MLTSTRSGVITGLQHQSHCPERLFMALPTVLLVPGAYHKPSHMDPLVSELSGIDVKAVALTSSGDDPATLKDMHADADVIAQAAAAIDGPVVVVAHSYGGVPATQALSDANNVKRIIYLAAMQLEAGDSCLTPAGGALMPWVKRHQREGIGDYLEATTPLTTFYHDVDIRTAQRAASQVCYQSYASFEQRLTATAWKSIPSTYIVCEDDNAIPAAAQEVMAERADDVQRLKSSHSPFLSQRAALAQVIRRSLASA
jgi:pimeloyl-ACP methyl ester carboxylesterase